MTMVGRLVAGVVRLGLYPFAMLWASLSPRGRWAAGGVLAGGIALNMSSVHLGLLPTVVFVAVTAVVVAWRRRGRARRSTLGQAAGHAVGGRSVLLLTAMAAEHVPPFEMASMLSQARADGWGREVAEIRAAVEALSSTSEVAHLVWVQELRRAEDAQGVWRPSWMGGVSGRVPAMASEG